RRRADGACRQRRRPDRRRRQDRHLLLLRRDGVLRDPRDRTVAGPRRSGAPQGAAPVRHRAPRLAPPHSARQIAPKKIPPDFRIRLPVTSNGTPVPFTSQAFLAAMLLIVGLKLRRCSVL